MIDIMRTQNGFIQIPIIITVIVSILVLSVGGYFGVKQYQDYQAEKTGKESEAKVILETQQKSLEQAQVEIEKLKTESATTKQNQQVLENKIKNETQKSQSQNISISTSEIEKYLTGIVRISCDNTMGSGSLWNFSDTGYAVLTNKHVIENPYPKGHCFVFLDSVDISNYHKSYYTAGLYIIYPFEDGSNFINKNLDAKALKIKSSSSASTKPNEIFPSIPIKDLNYGLSSVSKCKKEMPIGSPVVIIGYPAFTQKETKILGISKIEYAKTVTNGIISAYDSADMGIWGNNLSNSNYFVSAKIDSGNSGGIAIAKTKDGLCVLGIPTWLNIGNYDTQGIIQNIHNVMYQN